MKVDNLKEISEKNYLKKLNSQQRSLIKAKENEIKLIKQTFDNEKNNIRNNNEERLFSLKDRHQTEVLGAAQEKEQKIGQYKNDLKKTFDKVQKEKEVLTKTNRERVKFLNQRFEEKNRDLFHDAESKSRNLNELVDTKVKNLEFDTERAIQNKKHELSLLKQQSEYNHNNELKKIQSHYNLERNRRNIDFSSKLSRLTLDHQKKINQITNKNKREEAFHLEVQKNLIKNKENENKEILKQKDISLKKKYQRMVVEHDAFYKRLINKFDEQMNKLSKDHSSVLKIAKEKKADPFYKTKILTPVLSEFKDYYIVSLDIPNYEKENVRINAQGRKITLSFSRHSNERIEGQNNSVHHTKRTESFSKEFQAKDIMNPNAITRNYQNGTLQFKILKA